MGKTHIAALAAMLVGCGTPYQASGIRGGYEDYRAGAGAIMVTFSGNAYTSGSAVTRMWHQRAAEICGGPEQYVVLDAQRSEDQQEIGASTSTTNATVNGNHVHATTVHNEPTRVSRYKVEGLIRCVNGGSYDPNRKLYAD